MTDPNQNNPDPNQNSPISIPEEEEKEVAFTAWS